jgi:hypothetical protein
VNPTLRFCVGNPLNSVRTGFPAHRAERMRAADLEDRFLDSAKGTLRHRHDFDAEAMLVGESGVHAKEIRGKQRGLIAPSARPYFDNTVAVVKWISRYEERLDLDLEALDRGLESGYLSTSLGDHFGVIDRNELARRRELVFESIKPSCKLGHGRQSGVFPSQLGHTLRISDAACG